MSTPQPQQNLIVVQVALFESKTSTSPPTEHGNVKCAIAAQPASPNPRYKLVCYSEGAAACVATIGATNENSIQFEMQTADYASFKDDNGNPWSIMFLRSIDVEIFLAHLTVAFFGASGSPTHSSTIADFAPTGTKGSSIAPSVSGKKAELGRRIKARYTAYSVKRAQSPLEVPKISELLETNGDAPYGCDPVQSPFGIPADGKGFESSLVGASEGCWRVIVIPQSMPRSCNTPMLNIHTVVFVVQVTKVMPNEQPMVSTASFASALVLSGGSNANYPHHHQQQQQQSHQGGGGGQLVLAGESAPSVFGGGGVFAPVNGPSPASYHTQGQGIGAGIPSEHMLFVQKLAGQVNTAVSTLKDLQDRVDAIAMEHKQHLNRPKPSHLSAAALETNVKNLIGEHERLRDELLRREELIRALDDRNRDLQKAVDKAAMAAQQLLDEKKKATSKTSDNRLESDRGVMKIQEGILRARSERDDLARHLQTVKKLLDASDMDLRDAKGKKEVLQVQLQAMGGKLDAEEENLAEERSRRKAFEAKVGALTEETRNAVAEVHLKTAQVEDWRRKADAERVHYMQLMEDERSRRAVESAQLRSEIVDELQQRDRKFESDRVRTQQEHFGRGHDEGKEVGRKTARADFDVRMQELALDTQRAKTENDAYKEQLREAQESAQANHRRLDAAISALKQQVEEGTRNKASLEFQVQRASAQVKSAEDMLFLGVSALAHRLVMPIDPSDVLAQLENMRAGKVMDLSVQERTFAAATLAARDRRQGVVFDTMIAEHEAGLEAIYDGTVAQGKAALEATTETVMRLWAKRLADQRYAVESSEHVERDEIRQEEQVAIDAISAVRRAQQAARLAIETEEEDLRRPLCEEETAVFNTSVEAITTALRIQKEQRQQLEAEEDAARPPISAEEATTFAAIVSFAQKQAAERLAVEQEADAAAAPIRAEEAAGFAAVEAIIFEAKIKAQKAFFDEEAQQRESVQREVQAEQAAVELECHAEGGIIESAQEWAKGASSLQRDAVEHRESLERGSIAVDMSSPVKEMLDEFTEKMPSPPRPAPAAAAPSSPEPKPAAKKTSTTAPAAAPAGKQPAKRAPGGAPVAERALQNEFTLPDVPVTAKKGVFGGSDDDDDESKTATSATSSSSPSAPAAAPKPAAKPAAAGGMFGGSDSDNDTGSAPKAAPKAAAPKVVPKQGGALFGSDSDNDGGGNGAATSTPAPAAPQKSAPKKAVVAKAAKLFASDSD